MQKIKLKTEKLSFQANEALKTLRTNIEFSAQDLKVVSFTSALPNEGKSTIARRVAISFAEAGKKTLLIDADLRKSVMHRIVETGNVACGLADYLVGREKIMDVLAQTDLPNLFILFAGYIPPSPSELLSGSSFERLLESARQNFDMVIIDTPPVGEVIDGAIVAAKCDGVVVVLRQGKISHQLAEDIKRQLLATGSKVLGCVLNRVENERGAYGKYYGKKYAQGYGYYGYYQKTNDENK